MKKIETNSNDLIVVKVHEDVYDFELSRFDSK